MATRACIFIDGENFRHSLCRVFTKEHKPEIYLPKKANWSELIHTILDLVGNDVVLRSDLDLVRCYWYVVGEFSCTYHFKTKGFNEEPLHARLRYLREHAPSIINGLSETSDEKKIVGGVDRAMLHLRKQSDALDAKRQMWNSIQTDIQTTTNKLEFRRAGYSYVTLDSLKWGQEKGVDVKLATDMLMLREIYDVAILVSGDADYIPAVSAVKDLGKHVVAIDFVDKNGNLLPGGAKKLKEHCDGSVSIPFEFLKRICGY